MQHKERKIADGSRAVESNSGGKKSYVEKYVIPKENRSEDVVGQQQGTAELTLPHLPDSCGASKGSLGTLSEGGAY